MIFESNPISRAATHADTLFHSQDRNVIQSIIEDIEAELSSPSQNVRDIVDCKASESALREFLLELKNQLRQLNNLDSR